MENEEPSLLWSRNVTCLSFVPLIWWAACHPLGSSSVSDITLGKWKQGFFPAVSPWHFSSSVIINHFFTLKLFSLLCPYWIYSTYTSRSHCLLLPSTHCLPIDFGNFLLLCKSLCFAPFFTTFPPNETHIWTAVVQESMGTERWMLPFLNSYVQVGIDCRPKEGWTDTQVVHRANVILNFAFKILPQN